MCQSRKKLPFVICHVYASTGHLIGRKRFFTVSFDINPLEELEIMASGDQHMSTEVQVQNREGSTRD